MSYPQYHVLPSSHPKTPRHSLKKASVQTPICLLIALCHVASKLGVNNDSQEGRLPGRMHSPTPSPPTGKSVPLLASMTFIFIALSLALCKALSGEDDKKEEEKMTEHSLEATFFCILKF